MFPLKKLMSDASRIIYGGMHLGGEWNNNPISIKDEKATHAILETCIECAINVIDLADIYTFGKAEAVIGRVLKKSPKLAEQLYIQSKVGIKLAPTYAVNQYDFSPEYVASAIDASLERLQIEKLDVLFLHRPDPLMEAQALAARLNHYWHEDKFTYLAVSNMHAGQMAMLEQYLDMPIIANQLEMSLLHHGFIEDGITTNSTMNSASFFPRGTLEYCMQKEIQLQAWGATAQGQFANLQHSDNCIANTARLLEELSEKYAVSSGALVLAWLMRHPASIQPLIGTTKPDRIRELSKATTVTLSRDDWYLILQTRRGAAVP
ncbi:MAG: aldo/keto reductase [Pseudomonadota bacterium]